MSGNVAVAILAAAAVGAVLPTPSALTTPYAARTLPGGAKIAPEELRNYAEALLELRQVRSSLADALAKNPPAAAPLLRRQASVAAGEILRRRGIGASRFNQISHRVDSDPATRRTVHQFVMHQQVGI